MATRPRKPQSDPQGVDPPVEPGSAAPAARKLPSEIARETTAALAAWSHGEMGVGRAWQDLADGKITHGQYLHRFIYTRAVMKQAMKMNRANPHMDIGVVDHARLIHQDNVAKFQKKQQREAEAAKPKPKKKAR